MKLFTVNLEEKMIKSKQKTLNKLQKEEKLQENFLNQVQNLIQEDNQADYNLLKQVGFSTALSNAQLVKFDKDNTTKLQKHLGNNRIFTINEIQDIAVSYGLKFLPTTYYKGSIPSDTAFKIKESNNIISENKLSKFKVPGYIPRNQDHLHSEYYILAPNESFQLQERPKDPLLFRNLGEGQYYLIHKWGNDLNVTNYIKNIPFKNSVLTGLTMLVILFSLCIKLLTYSLHLPKEQEGTGGLLFLLSILAMFASFFASVYVMKELKENKTIWNSPYKD